MNVTLISHTQNPEKVIASAAKLCYSPSSVEDIYSGLSDEKVSGFVEMLAEIGHESPIEHASFTFGIEGISRACSHQLVRHRIASYSQQSQRYVAEGNFDYVIPPEIAADDEAKAVFEESMRLAQNQYDRIAAILAEKHKKMFIRSGKDEKTAARLAQKKAIEDARFVLPNACETKIVVTMNARTLMNFFKHRCCNRAQWEIRELADRMLELVKEVAPNLFKYAGPSCVGGKCPEGKMSCGQAAEMRKKYSEGAEN